MRLVSGHPTLPPEWDAAVRTSGDTFLYHLSEIAPMVMPPDCTDPLSFIECRLGENLVGGAVLELPTGTVGTGSPTVARARA